MTRPTSSTDPHGARFGFDLDLANVTAAGIAWRLGRKAADAVEAEPKFYR
jgi:hypothetical protein